MDLRNLFYISRVIQGILALLMFGFCILETLCLFSPFRIKNKIIALNGESYFMRVGRVLHWAYLMIFFILGFSFQKYKSSSPLFFDAITSHEVQVVYDDSLEEDEVVSFLNFYTLYTNSEKLAKEMGSIE